jgi:cation diffusion facilitator family transporter
MAGSGHGEGGRRAIIAAFLANLGIAISKLVAFLFTGASSMLAESIHSFADTGNQALLILGGARARRLPSADHPFGYGRVRYFWAFVVALVLFTLGGLFAIYEGIQKLRDPHEIESPAWAFGVLILAIALESFSFRTAIREGERVRGTLTWWSFIHRSKSPELPVVLLEDLGALFGLSFALAGVSAAVATGDARWDAAGSLTIGLLLIVIAAILAVEMKSLLIGEAADPQVAKALEDSILGGPHVRRLIHMRTEHLGPEELLVTAKVEFEDGLSGRELTAAINATEDLMRRDTPMARVIYLEPDVFDGDAAC